MERHTYEKGTFLCKKDALADRLYLIQDGIVEVAIKYDRRREDQNFVIERLGRGAIINHRSFMVNDDADTDFVCRTTVSAFYLTSAKLNEVMKKRNDLATEQTKVSQTIYAPLYPLALDYIFHNNERQSVDLYYETLRKNELRVKFKNAIMQHWTKVKEKTAVGSLQTMIDQMLKKKRSNKDGLDYKQQEDKKEELKQKMEQRKVRKIAKQEQLERESKDSYVNMDQYQFLQSNIEIAGKRLREQQNFIDQMEFKMIKHLEQRRSKERQTMDKNKPVSFLMQQ